MGARVSRTVSAVSKARASVPKQKPEQTTAQSAGNDSALDAELNTANEKLLGHLKSVYVESKDIAPDPSKPLSGKLPQERSSAVHDPLDISEPVDGYLLVKQVIEILDKQRINKDKVDARVLAKQYKMDKKDIENLLKYFGNYYVRPNEEKDKFELKYHLLHR